MILPHKSILRRAEHLDERRLVQGIKRGDNREASRELRDKPILHQIVRVNMVQDILFSFRAPACRAGEAYRVLALEDAPVDYFFHSLERAAAHEQHIVGLDLQEVLMRMLAPALRRDIGFAALDYLEQRLLHAFARHITSNRRIDALARDLVYLVYVDNALFGARHIVVGSLDETQQDVLDILTNIARLGQRGGVSDGERDLQDARKRLSYMRLA